MSSLGSQITDARLRTAFPVSRGGQLATMVVFVDGISRSGKSMLGPILSGFERVEIERVEESFEYVGALHWLGKIEQDAAVALLQTYADIFLYNSLIARNTNFRVRDHSGVWNSGARWRYLRRLLRADGQSVTVHKSTSHAIFQNQTHDQLRNIALYLESFGDRLRFIEMVRHPVDLIDSWLRRGWGTRFCSDPRAFTLCVRCGEQLVPYYASGWEQAYLNASPVGRVIRAINSGWTQDRRAFQALPPAARGQVMLIVFEHFVQKPAPYLEQLAAFLGTPPAKSLSRALKRARIPRNYSMAARAQRHAGLEARATLEERELIEEMIADYEDLINAAGLE